MYNAMLVGISHGIGQFQDQSSRFFHREPATAQFVGQRGTFHKSHGIVVLAGVRADIVDRHDPRVVQSGRRFRFAIEPPHGFLGGEVSVKDHLQCDGALQLQSRRP